MCTMLKLETENGIAKKQQYSKETYRNIKPM